MKTRHTFIASTAIIGIVLGPAASRAFPAFGPTGVWSSLLFIFIGCAVGLPLVLGYFATSGKYNAMIQLWSLFGLVAVLFVAMGVSAAVQSAMGSGFGHNSALFVVVGAGFFAGLALVKLTIHRARAKHGAS